MMQYHEFLAQVRRRGEYADQQEAEKVTRVVLEVLAQRIPRQESLDLAAQLPGSLGEVVAAAAVDQPESLGIERFCERVAERVQAVPRTAQWDASAVLSTLADSVSPGQLNQLISVLPTAYADLFGQTDLSQ
ncbi:DUF2267 domain-containing protein [Actinomadura nitritigenes]|uniref:DUF2267 domain-containing protein n=1 Tax=Actinomadura nitritigenes TaxID=134602 RepID=UPI003D8B4647